MELENGLLLPFSSNAVESQQLPEVTFATFNTMT